MKARVLVAVIGLSEPQLSLFRSGRLNGIRFRALAKFRAALDFSPV